MRKKSTGELENVLGGTHTRNVAEVLEEEAENFLSEDRPFAGYMREKFKEKKLQQKRIFIEADIPDRYGYKLISEEKRTDQRDTILRICYAARFTLVETQQALRIYGMPQLYARVPRDAILMVAFNERPGSVIDVNELLAQNGALPLRSSGVQE